MGTRFGAGFGGSCSRSRCVANGGLERHCTILLSDDAEEDCLCAIVADMDFGLLELG